MSTPTGWRKMTKKINNTVLKTSTRTNDYSPGKLNRDSGATDMYQEIQAITDYRINNGTEQYQVLWCSPTEDVKTSWETEKTIDTISKDALPKYWIKNVLSNTDEIIIGNPDSDLRTTTTKMFVKKLKHWTSKAPSLKTEEDDKDIKELFNSSINTPSKKRRRTFISEEDLSGTSPNVEMKHPKLSGKINENVTVSSNNTSFGQIKGEMCAFKAGFSSFLKPDQIFDLTDAPQFEVGEVINYTKNPGDDSKSYLVTWLYVSNETADTLGIKEKALQKHFYSGTTEGENHRYQLQRKKHDSTIKEKSSIREVRIRGESCSPHSDYSDQSESTTIPPSETGTLDQMDYVVFKGPVTDVECQTTIEIDPFACLYCQAGKGEDKRLSSLRQRGGSKKKQEKEEALKKQKSKVKADPQADDEDEDDDDLVAIEYEIDKILNYRKVEGTNVDEYYIRWKGFTSHYDTWEPLENLSSCDKALVIFYVDRVAERKHSETEISKLMASGNYAAAKKLNKPLPLPPVPQILMDMLSTAAPISDEEIELAFKVSKTVRKNGRWTKMKLRKILLDLIGESTGPGSQSWSMAAAKDEMPVIRHQLLMLESERRKELVLKDIKEWEKKLNNIAKGRPEIVVENDYDLAGPPSDFRYINDNVLGEGVTFPDHPLEGCSCEESCIKSQSCCPAKHGKQIAYNIYKRLRVYPGYPIYECNKRCKCGPECQNRVVQDGTFSLLGTKLCIFRTSNERGWGVKSLKKIKRGSFVCLYAGEIITSEEAENRGKIYENQLGASYLFDLDYYEEEGDSCPYTIDATKMGNVSHFINHSCEPNLCVFNVWADCLDQNLPKLAFFALRDINKDEELTYDYGTHDDDDPVMGMNTPPIPSMALPEITDGDEESDENTMIPPTSSPSKNRLKPATASGVRTACLCGAETCRKVLF